MIKLKSILTESEHWFKSRSVNINLEKTKLLLQGKASSAWEKHLKDYRIFRGMDSNNEFKFISPSKTTRESRNTLNIVNSFLDILPSWKNWPKRSNSIICSTSIRGAEFYGYVFQVFPFDNAKIGICSQSDFWTSFPVIKERFPSHDIDSLNYTISNLYTTLGLKVNFQKFTTEQVKQLIDYLNKKTHGPEGIRSLYSVGYLSDKYVREMLVDMINFYKGGDWIKYFDGLFNPEKNNFQLTTIEEYSQLNTDKEVWTDSDSLMVRMSSLKDITNR